MMRHRSQISDSVSESSTDELLLEVLLDIRHILLVRHYEDARERAQHPAPSFDLLKGTPWR